VFFTIQKREEKTNVFSSVEYYTTGAKEITFRLTIALIPANLILRQQLSKAERR
jgi:hypothetical protein